ncbi:hypothetical protein DFH11DRAFT_1607650 [Phellopilus nigrolimitatus]|nr:hypothetical protein DFH11DRAFT_1607650 [Phellopilus nigrolimitatus]
MYVDPDLITTDSSHSSTARETGFRDALLTRDGMCPFTSVSPGLCDAAHLLARAKGNEYIRLMTSMRTKGQLVIEEIDDPRNGLLVDVGIHGRMGVLGFLPVYLLFFFSFAVDSLIFWLLDPYPVTEI